MQPTSQCTRCGYATAPPWSRCWCCGRPLYRCTRARRHLLRTVCGIVLRPFRSAKGKPEDLAELIAAW